MTKKNIRLILILLVAVVLASAVTYATTFLYNSNVVSYDNTSTGLTADNVQDALDELYTMASSSGGCPSGYECTINAPLKIGGYVSYASSVTSYTPTGTGYSSPGTINPSELTTWRVIRINDNNTIDLVSEKVSSDKIYFSNATGFKNIVGILNGIASQYETSGITVGSRAFGYNGQTETITDSSHIGSSGAPGCSTNGTIGDCSVDPDEYESSGGGDILFFTDYDLVGNALGTRAAQNNEGTTTTYWMASRKYNLNGTYKSWLGRYVDTAGESATTGNGLYYYQGGTVYYATQSHSVRPIITLQANLSYTGEGTVANPYVIVTN